MSAQQRATSLFSHYFRTAFKAAGLDWDGDHQSEIEEAVDALVDMVRDEIRMARDEAEANASVPGDAS